MLFGINARELELERKIHANEVAVMAAEFDEEREEYVEAVDRLLEQVAALKKAAEPKTGEGATKTVGTKSDGYFTFNINPPLAGWDGDSEDVMVKRADHYLPNPTNPWARFSIDVGRFDLGGGHSRETYKQAFTKVSAKLTELESFLADLLILDPTLNRFDAAEFSKKGKRRTPFKWNIAAVHDAAELLRADKAEGERREKLAELQGVNE